jgi:hypothetical protein
MKKSNIHSIKTSFLIFMMIGISINSFAQSTYIDFIKTANFLKENKSMYGYFNQGTDVAPKYASYEGSRKLEIQTVERVEGNVVSFKLDFAYIVSGILKPNSNDFPTYWTAGSTVMVCYNEHLIVLTADPAISDNFSIKQWFKIGKMGIKEKIAADIASNGTGVKLPFTKEELIAHLKPFVDASRANKKNKEANAKAAAEAHLAKYSIKGKDVVNIEIETKYNNASFGVGSTFEYGIIATLKDGTVIKTKNWGGEGYMEDYNIVVAGSYENGKVSSKPFKYLGDYVLISVSSKHHSSIKKVEKKLVFTYDQTVALNFNGNWTTSNGDPGKSIRVDVKVVNHSETNEEILEYKIYDDMGKLIHVVRLKRDALLKVSCNGGYADKEYNASKIAGNGGDGGNITLNLDPKVGDNYQFDYTNIGGNAGINVKNSFNNGRNGRDGKFTKNIKPIN